VSGALVTSDSEVIEAITAQRLARWSADGDSDSVIAARTTCATIAEQIVAEAQEVTNWLTERGHRVQLSTDSRPRQRHDVSVAVGSVEDADAAAQALGEIGFERWDRWTRAAATSFRRNATEIVVARTGDFSFVLRFRWPARHSRRPTLVRRIVRPTRGDWAMIDLPTPLWPLYSVVRPVRLVLERLGRRDPYASGLGPFLATPTSLIPALLDLAEVSAASTVLDIGCGDGRLSITAATERGCRAIGAELDVELVARARASAEEHGVADRVSIEHADARTADLSEIDVVFMFLPMDALTDVIGPTLDAMPAGARLVVHEQTPLSPSVSPPPDASVAVLAADAVTVAHRWTR
jgi:hypothetical protein